MTKILRIAVVCLLLVASNEAFRLKRETLKDFAVNYLKCYEECSRNGSTTKGTDAPTTTDNSKITTTPTSSTSSSTASSTTPSTTSSTTDSTTPSTTASTTDSTTSTAPTTPSTTTPNTCDKPGNYTCHLSEEDQNAFNEWIIIAQNCDSPVSSQLTLYIIFIYSKTDDCEILAIRKCFTFGATSKNDIGYVKFSAVMNSFANKLTGTIRVSAELKYVLTTNVSKSVYLTKLTAGAQSTIKTSEVKVSVFLGQVYQDANSGNADSCICSRTSALSQSVNDGQAIIIGLGASLQSTLSIPFSKDYTTIFKDLEKSGGLFSGGDGSNSVNVGDNNGSVDTSGGLFSGNGGSGSINVSGSDSGSGSADGSGDSSVSVGGSGNSSDSVSGSSSGSGSVGTSGGLFGGDTGSVNVGGESGSGSIDGSGSVDGSAGAGSSSSGSLTAGGSSSSSGSISFGSGSGSGSYSLGTGQSKRHHHNKKHHHHDNTKKHHHNQEHEKKHHHHEKKHNEPKKHHHQNKHHGANKHHNHETRHHHKKAHEGHHEKHEA